MPSADVKLSVTFLPSSVPFQFVPSSSVRVTLLPLTTPVNEWLAVVTCVALAWAVYASESVPRTAPLVRVH